jgi:hypothetical protein
MAAPMIPETSPAFGIPGDAFPTPSKASAA